MRIGELAQRTGVSERSLRYYEEQGLLVAERTPGGQRDFRDAAVDRVILIQELYAAGLHSKKISQLLPCMRDADGGPSKIATPRLVTDLTTERERINRMITDLIRSRDVLDEVIETAGASLSATGPGSARGLSDNRTANGVIEPARAELPPFTVRQSGRRQRGPGMSSLGSLRTEGPCSAGALTSRRSPTSPPRERWGV